MKHACLLSGFALALLALPACQRVTPPAKPEASETADASDATDTDATGTAALPVRPEAVETGAVIDWEAARRDLAARPIEEREGSFQIASGGEAPPVPVFLPSAGVAIQGGEAGVRFQQTSDGYYAFFPGDAYDVIVNGTNVVIRAPGEATAVRNDDYVYQPTTTGASVTFSQYNADYIVEFECKVITGGTPACITQDEALAFARDLAIAGTR